MIGLCCIYMHVADILFCFLLQIRLSSKPLKMKLF